MTAITVAQDTTMMRVKKRKLLRAYMGLAALPPFLEESRRLAPREPS